MQGTRQTKAAVTIVISKHSIPYKFFYNTLTTNENPTSAATAAPFFHRPALSGTAAAPEELLDDDELELEEPLLLCDAVLELLEVAMVDLVWEEVPLELSPEFVPVAELLPDAVVAVWVPLDSPEPATAEVAVL